MATPSRRSLATPRLVVLPAGERLWRVSRDPAGTAFSTSARARRFSPLSAADGSVIPAWYGGSTRAGAIFESVFHDIRPSHRSPRVFPNQYLDLVLSPVLTTRPLQLIDLTTDGLHAIGVSRTALIESTSHRYQWTADIAAHLRQAAPGAEGMIWVSRARDTSRSVVLYGNPSQPDPIEPDNDTGGLALGAGAGMRLLRELATAAKITVVSPNPPDRPLASVRQRFGRANDSNRK